jgi:hypothetical protein
MLQLRALLSRQLAMKQTNSLFTTLLNVYGKQSTCWVQIPITRRWAL